MNRLAEIKGGGLPVAGSVRRVLVVDDSAAHRRLMGSVLSRWGHDVTECASAAAAMEALRAREFDLVLSDWVMPEMTGLELCRAFRALRQERYVYFILLTSKSERADVAEGLAAGSDDFLSKPLNTDELRARITAGERLLSMQRALEQRNAQLADALTQLQSAHDRIARDLVEARRLQQSLVPRRALSFDGADVSLLLRPCGEVGGDLVGSFALRNGSVGVYSIDVCGHGIASALMTARLAGYFSDASRHRNVAVARGPDGTYAMRPPVEVCDELNAVMASDTDTELYFTMALASCDTHTGRVTIAQAGHPHPVVQRASGEVEFVGTGGMPIGLLDEAQFGCFDILLEPGDRLFLHSDGFIEQSDGHGGMFDEEGLARALRNHRSERGEALMEAICWELGEYAGTGEFDDDLSGVLFEYRGPPVGT